MRPAPIPKRRRQRTAPFRFIQTDTLAVVQLIGVAWSKEYRGGAGAAERNRIPEAERVPWPERVVTEPAYVQHAAASAFSERKFIRGMLDSHHPGRPMFTVRPLTDSLEFRGLTVRFADNRLHVDYAWNDDSGMPKRYPRPDALVLEKGEWGRIRLNERHSHFFTVYGWDASEWWYEKWVLNAGLFDAFQPSVFLDTAPAKVVSLMEQLW